MTNKVFLGIVIIIGIIALMGISSTIIAAVIYYVWNLVISDVFTLKQITFLQSWLIGLGLSIVGSLFKSSLSIKK